MASNKEERESLLKTGDTKDSNGTFATEEDGGSSPEAGPESDSLPSNVLGEDNSDQQKQSTRGALPRNPSMEKVDEEEADTLGALKSAADAKAKEVRMRSSCPDYFGVKSYLHHFYDTHFYKDPDIYEDEDDFRYLLHPNPRRRRCTSIWWKVFVWIGANFLVFGIIGVLVGYLVPQKPIVVGSIADNIEIIDREAISFNFNLDVCKLVGLILFCIGGLTLTVALLFPSFLYQYCEDDGRDSSFKVRMGDDEEEPLKSPLEMSIPTTTMVSNVQPDRKETESVVTQGGMVPMKDWQNGSPP